MIGKFLISMTFAIAYLYTAELFPTKVRNVAVGTASTFARIGSMSAPYIVDLLVSSVRFIHLLSLPYFKFNLIQLILLSPTGSCPRCYTCDYFRDFFDHRGYVLPDVARDVEQETA